MPTKIAWYTNLPWQPGRYWHGKLINIQKKKIGEIPVNRGKKLIRQS